MASTPATKQFEHLSRDAAEVVPTDELLSKLQRSVAGEEPLRVKLGLDPTAPDVTLGWAVVLRKLREFQNMGHTAVLIVGDFTAQVGDPSGKSETRPRLSAHEVRVHADRLLGQFWRILDRDRTEVRYNSEWLAAMGMEDILRLTASATVAQMLERDDFAKRFAEHLPISIMEFLYPLLQGWDSVAVRADVELGGTDQKFNLLVGRALQRDVGQEPQVAFTMPLLVGLDGVNKMSQSLGNYVGIEEAPAEMFGKLMSIPDELTEQYIELCTDLKTRWWPDLSAEEREAAEGRTGPNRQKRLMARAVVALYHDANAANPAKWEHAREAEERFDRVHREHQIPDDVPEAPIPADLAVGETVWLPRLLAALGLVASNSEGRRKIVEGAVRLDGERVTDAGAEFAPADLKGRVLQVGARRFVRIAREDG
jgi:tyrosyl-tRNA synthetase